MVKTSFGRKPGFIHILLILIIFGVVSIAGYSAYKYKISKIFASGFPTGSVAANPISTTSNGFVILTTQNAVGANGAQVESVRYFLLNPTLKVGNTYGNPDWCSNPDPCSQSSQATYITYDLGESSNTADNYKVSWDTNTKSPNSAGRDRSLSSSNISPGSYQIGIKVRDLNGNETGNASMVTVTITDGSTPAPTPTPTPLPDLGLKFSTTYFGMKMSPGGVGKKAFDLTSTGATKFSLYAPTNSLGIRLVPPEGTIAPGQTIPIYVKADPNQQYGIYTGKVYASSSQINAQTETGVSDSITVEPSTSDSDADGFPNSAELKMGTDPNYSCKTPSAINAWPPDVNNDGVINTVDSQAVFNAFSAKKYVARYDMNGDGVIGSNDAQKVYSYIGKTCQSTVADNDKDGFGNDIETYVGTDMNRACSLPGNVKAWAVDFNNDGGVGMTTDMLQLIQHSGVNSGSPSYDRRYDLNADGIINDADQAILKYFAGRTCTPGI